MQCDFLSTNISQPHMEDTDALLRELRIDWETLITDDFNPLKQALRNKNSSAEASNFRNLFHRVEKVMEGIIEKSYKGFSDSVLSYMESHSLNKRCSDSILRIGEATSGLLGIKIEVKDMTREYSEAEFSEMKYGLCVELLEMKRNFNEFCVFRDEAVSGGEDGEDVGTKLQEAAKRISRIYEVMDRDGVSVMECVKKFREEMESEVSEFMRMIYRRLDLFVFHNKREYQGDFRCIVSLNALVELERYQADSFEKEYSGLVESVIREVDRRKEDERLETLVKTVMGRTRMVVDNFDVLWQMANTAFEDLDAKARNFFDEEGTVLRIYSPSGRSVVEAMAQKVLERFMAEYTEEPGRHLDDEEFRVEDLVDDIDYASVFENKYVIHERMVHGTGRQEGFSGCFTRICPPSMETAIFMKRYAFSDGMQQYLSGVLDSRYVKEKRREVERRMVHLFNDHEWCRSDYSRRRLLFYPSYERFISEFTLYPELCGISMISDFLGDIIEKKFLVFLGDGFRSQMVRDSLSDGVGDEGQMVGRFRRWLLVKAIDRNTLFLQKQYYENRFFAIETLRDINRTLGDRRVEDVKTKISRGFSLQILLEVFYFFDLFYREGRYTNKDDYYLHRILRIIEDMYDVVQGSGMETRMFGLIFECLNFYIQNNVDRLNVRSVEELGGFREKVKLLDEILGLVPGEESLKESISFINDSVSMCSNSENSRRLRQRVGMGDSGQEV